MIHFRRGFPQQAFYWVQFFAIELLTVFRCQIKFGVGKAVLVAMESYALKSGLSEIHLSSTFTAKPFYLRNGFASSGAPEVAFGVKAFPLIKRLGRAQGHALE